MQKRGMDLSMNAIIIAALILLLIIVLSFILTGNLKFFKRNVEDCHLKGGECKAECPVFSTLPSACPDDQKCCMEVPDEDRTAG